MRLTIAACAVALPAVALAFRLPEVGPWLQAAASPATAQACQSLQKQLGADKVVTGRFDPAYLTSLSAYYNQLQAKVFPSCVVYPTSAQDVQAAVKAIRASNSKFAVKAGGHTYNLWSSTEKGVQIDLGRMMAKSYDAASDTGFFEPGNRARDVYPFFEKFGRAPVAARLGGVGSGALLGCAASYLSGKHGLGCDNFVQLDVVLPDGSFVQATRTNQYSDLFRALQGGGNIAGIITGYRVKVWPVGQFFSGGLFYYPSQAEAIANATRAFLLNNKDANASIIPTINTVPFANGFGKEQYQSFIPAELRHLDEFVLVYAIYDGPDSKGAFKVFEDLKPVYDNRKLRTYTDSAAFADITIATGGSYGYTRAYRMNSDKYIQSLRNSRKFSVDFKGYYNSMNLEYSLMPSFLIDASNAAGGNSLGLPAGPWTWVQHLITFDPNQPQAKLDELRSAFQKMAELVPNDPDLPLFLNYAAPEQNVLSTYGKYADVLAAKRKYDPSSFFSTNQPGPLSLKA